jgi:hypothetical protein
MLTHKIKNIRFDKGYMFLTVDKKIYKIKLSDVSTKLSKASDKARNDFKISASGYGIHWTKLDEDLSVDGLIKQATKPLGLTPNSRQRAKV